MIDEKLISEILDEQKVAALGLVTPEGLPHTTPIWISSKDGKFYIFSRAERAKVKYAKLNNNAMVAFKWASMRAKVNIIDRGTPAFEPIKDLMDERYGEEDGYDEYKKNWDVALELIPTKLYR